ncbi:MAG TPA: tetratricopeptide repeat protein, partial [Polyangiaceae bacterium]|nr:tetratricopeptide repeat protein [Polyangiaceae bacterium]
RLEERFKLLAGGPRFASERQRTMRGAIDWSWELLGETERAALAQCSMFRGGFAIDAAEKIIDVGDGSSPMLDTLQSLSDKSLVFASDLRDLGERRYRLYESVRAYALDRLRESGGEESALDRHARYFADAGARWAKAAARGDATEPRNRIAVELENLLGAHRHALARASLRTSGMATTAFTLLRPIAELLKRRGPLDLLLSLLDATLVDAISSQTDPSLVGEALRDRAMARHFAPDAGTAKIADLTRALEIARQAKDVALELSCLNVLVSVELLHGRPDAARQHVRVAVERARAHGDTRALAKAYSDLGACDLAVGRIEEARASLQEAIALSRTAGDRLETALYLARLSETVLQLGRFEEAQACADEGFELASPFHQNRVLALLSGVRAIIAYEQEKLELAHARYGEALTFAEHAGAELLYPFYRASRGAVLADMDDIAGATADVAAATAVLPRFADDAVLGVTVRITQGHLDLAFARAAERAGDVDAALTHRLNAGRCLDSIDESKSDFEDLRLMRRRLERAIARSSGGLTPSTGDDREGALVVEQSGEWFRTPSGEHVDLSQRPNLKRLLVSLMLHRVGASGEPLSLAAVFRSGWPGERADDDSAANRARVAMARLRKLGLRDVLLTKGGYYLDPSVRVVIARRDDV